MIGLSEELLALVDAALAEDVGTGDVSTLWTVPAAQEGTAEIVAKQPGVLAGVAIVEVVFRRINGRVAFEPDLEDGATVAEGQRVGTVRGPLRAILTGERTALNFLQRLSGIATLTRRYVDALEGTGARVLDTRKTTPGWRAIERAAVRAGGGHNHRSGLYDMVLLKENHIAAAGGVAEAIDRVRKHNDDGLSVEVEVRTLGELEHALVAGVDRVLLDNMDLDATRQAVRRIQDYARWRGTETVEIEASGNMTLERVRDVAAAGVDFVSVGALTHSAPSLDLSLRVVDG